MRELLQLLIKEAESEERNLWYRHGYEVEDRTLQVLLKILERALRNLDDAEGK